MNKTRKGFLNAGAIVAIVLAAVVALMAFMLIGLSNFVTADFLVDVYKDDTQNYQVHYVVEGDESSGIDYFVDNFTGEKITVKEVKNLAKLAHTVLTTMGWGALLLEVGTLVSAIFVIKNSSNNKIGAIISLLVFSVIGGNFLTFAFMIVGLCLKNKPVIEIESQQA